MRASTKPCGLLIPTIIRHHTSATTTSSKRDRATGAHDRRNKEQHREVQGARSQHRHAEEESSEGFGGAAICDRGLSCIIKLPLYAISPTLSLVLPANIWTSSGKGGTSTSLSLTSGFVPSVQFLKKKRVLLSGFDPHLTMRFYEISLKLKLVVVFSIWQAEKCLAFKPMCDSCTSHKVKCFCRSSSRM